MDYQAIADEINNDPEGLGYAEHVASGADSEIAKLLNEVADATLTMKYITRNEFIKGIAPSVLGLAGKSADVQTKWDRVIQLLGNVEKIEVADATVQGMFALAISDGLLTAEQIEDFTTRRCSRAETLFGEGASIGQDDVARALRSE